MSATGTPSPADSRTVAMRRPGCTAARASLTRSGSESSECGVEVVRQEREPPELSRLVASASGGHDFEDHLGHAEERLLHLTPVSRRAFADAAQLEPLLGERVDRAIEVGGEHDEVVDRDDVVRVRGGVGDVGRRGRRREAVDRRGHRRARSDHDAMPGSAVGFEPDRDGADDDSVVGIHGEPGGAPVVG